MTHWNFFNGLVYRREIDRTLLWKNMLQYWVFAVAFALESVLGRWELGCYYRQKRSTWFCRGTNWWWTLTQEMWRLAGSGYGNQKGWSYQVLWRHVVLHAQWHLPLYGEADRGTWPMAQHDLAIQNWRIGWFSKVLVAESQTISQIGRFPDGLTAFGVGGVSCCSGARARGPSQLSIFCGFNMFWNTPNWPLSSDLPVYKGYKPS